MTEQDRFDDYDPRAWLERSGLLFLHRDAIVAAAEVFQRLIDLEPGYAMAWYGLSNATYQLSAKRRDLRLLCDSVVAARRCLELDPDNQLASQFVAAFDSRTPVSPEQIETMDVPSSISEEMRDRVGCKESTFAEALDAMPEYGERIQTIMWLSTFSLPGAIPLLARGIVDEHPNVCMASLKRIDATDIDSRIQQALESLIDSESANDREPYLSMALRRIGAKSVRYGAWARDAVAKRDADS